MMNDRFSAQLRQHLLQNADERPAAGQLEALVERVAVTRQHSSVAARLTWFPGRIGPFPAAAVRYGLVVLALVAAMVAAVVIGAGTAPTRSTVFEGTWTSTDVADGSTQTLVVGTGTKPALHFEDDYATGAACVEDEVKVFRADGSGDITGNRMDVAFPDGGGCGLMTVDIGVGYYDYKPDTDSLVDSQGLPWFRTPSLDAQPTRAPATPAPLPKPTAVPTPDAIPVPTPEAAPSAPECIDMSQGGTHTGNAGPLSLTAIVPDAPAIPWQGWHEGFHLSSRCTPPEPISIFATAPTPVSNVLGTSCMPGSLEITSFAEAIARLDTPTGDDISDRLDLTIGGHPAARYDVVDLASCPGGFGLWGGTILGPGETGSIYVIDVDGLLLAIELNRDGNQTPAEIEEAWAIVASLQFAR